MAYKDAAGTTAGLDNIISEETKWANEANAERDKARLLVYGTGGGYLAGTLLLLAFSIFAFFKWGKEYKPKFQDKYLREMPSNDHPAVLGTVWNWGAVGNQDFTATLMRLSRIGVIELMKGTREKRGLFGPKLEDDYVLMLKPDKVGVIVDPIDMKAYEFLEKIAGSDNMFYFSQIKEWGTKHPETFTSAMDDWKLEVSAVDARRGFFEESGKLGKIGLAVLAIILVAVDFFVVMPLALESANGFVGVAGFVGIIAAIVIFIISRKMNRRSPEAAELQARCEGLRNWLRDFSLLNEAPPTHVKVWDDFLVMAVVFGIAERVIEQMKLVVPQVINDPSIAPTIIWCASYGSLGSPSTAFASSMDSTASSIAAAASSSHSSGGGFGGGFSGGGGGGFGGGGGGGAG